MRYAKIFIVLAALAVYAEEPGQSVCSGLPVKTSDAAMCRVELFVAKGNRNVPATYEVKEHEDHWLVLHVPESSGRRAGGAKFKVHKASGSVDLVEMLEFIRAPQATPNTSLERTRER
jgi:hypothetical protein